VAAYFASVTGMVNVCTLAGDVAVISALKLPTALESPPGEVEGGLDDPAPQPMATVVKKICKKNMK